VVQWSCAVGTKNRAITIASANGSVRAVTGTGDVHIRVDADRDSQSVYIQSGSGRVIVELPTGFAGAVDLETGYTAAFGRAAKIESDWQLARATTPDFVLNGGTPQRYVRAQGTIGSGNGRVRVRTTNGDIELRRK